MKFIVNIIFLAALVYSGFVVANKPYVPCDTAITYKIGSIDSRFDLTQAQVVDYTKESAKILSNEYGKDLFLYAHDTAEITINFAYDERTALNANINKQQYKIETENSTLQQKVSVYEADVINFEKRLEEHNSKVQNYNSEGGAPPEVYDQLIKEQDTLKTEGDDLNARARQLNLETRTYNTQVNDLNQNVSQFNQAITQKPEEGLYDGQNQTITIFFVDNKPELIHTLAHEFGHALGMNHVDNPKALMYPFSTTYLEITEEDKTELGLACRNYPSYEYWLNNISYKMLTLNNNLAQ